MALASANPHRLAKGEAHEGQEAIERPENSVSDTEFRKIGV
ncbi:MAG TPA: hypothetical protein VF574_01730 [Allosphingosinicella sp.]|jgi:hypothetical protein